MPAQVFNSDLITQREATQTCATWTTLSHTWELLSADLGIANPNYLRRHQARYRRFYSKAGLHVLPLPADINALECCTRRPILAC
jgi:hypothetical protein